jgi:hypothetical protein
MSSIDLNTLNEEFRFLFSEADNPKSLQYKADFEDDLNFVVDSLEEEHIRRAVHTTRMIEALGE